jgi:hypothetical protein
MSNLPLSRFRLFFEQVKDVKMKFHVTNNADDQGNDLEIRFWLVTVRVRKAKLSFTRIEIQVNESRLTLEGTFLEGSVALEKINKVL